MLIYSLIAAAALWVFVCLWVAIPLQTVDETSWHNQMIFWKPRGNCAYFWSLLISPVVCVCFLVVCAIVMSILTLFRLLFDWLLMPICGKRVEGVLTQEYWKGFLEVPEKRVCRYAEFKYRNYWIGLVALLAVIAWIFVGGYCFYSLSSENDRYFGMVIVFLATWTILTSIILYCILSEYLKDSEKWRNFKEGAGLVTGKLCRRLEYKKSEKNSS